MTGVTAGAILLACASDAGPTKKKRTPIDPGDDYFGEEDTSQEDGLAPKTDPDSGAFGASSRPSNGGTDAGPPPDASGPKTYCTGALQPGDLAVVEILIAARTGASDNGEWVEIRSARPCWLKLKGVAIESPRGASGTNPPNTVTLPDDFELEPNGTFVVTDTLDATKHNVASGPVFAWNAVDVLKNDGDTISVKLGSGVIDTVTYPSFNNLEAGRTLAFPADCPANVRSDWQRWSLSFSSFGPGLKGTPNAANADVACY